MGAKTIVGKILNNVTGGLSQQIGRPIYDAVRGNNSKPSLNSANPSQLSPSAGTPGITNPITEKRNVLMDNVKNEGLNPLWLLVALIGVLLLKSKGK